MQDKLKNILKKASFGNAEPDKDWKKLFFFLAALLAIVILWSFYFYFGIQSDIAAAEASQPTAESVRSGADDKMKETISFFAERAAKNSAILSGGSSSLPSFVLEDPSRP